ncbi:hypothetical protein BOTBODRAFT_502650 [Botryobasidium botryosum FD-172 SS1]|uniref:Protein kinase domain-containing protein n=1 Tax=Botryobasidium botryosum (strain FD-172 SS1) TaxID=930990 RepID=A0A067M336_BOTB1|nr:hypothetical protein BOTBODRAFT_502650 [Botryobasidium botryosum FD-172 SS1]
MISPWMPNGDLKSFLKLHPEADHVLLLVEIAAGLEYLHMRNPAVVHGDLKATNVLVSEDEHACIADFGLSDTSTDPEEHERNGYSSTWKNGGNIRWQAPELLVSYQRTTQSDMFAFGRVIYEVFTGLVPFEELKEGQVYSVVDQGRLPPRPGIEW